MSVRTTFPRAWTEDIGHVGGKNHLVLTEQVGERIVLGRIFGENAFGSIILFVDEATHFGIDASTGLFRVGFWKLS